MSRHRRQQRKRARRGPTRTLADFGVSLGFAEGTHVEGSEYVFISGAMSWVAPVRSPVATRPLVFDSARRIVQGPLVIPDGVHAIAGQLETAEVKI